MEYLLYTEGGVQQPGANAHTQALNILPGCVIALILSNDRMGKMKNSLCSGLDSSKNLLIHVALKSTLVSMFSCSRPG